jgi:hypothetical protein
VIADTGCLFPNSGKKDACGGQGHTLGSRSRQLARPECIGSIRLMVPVVVPRGSMPLPLKALRGVQQGVRGGVSRLVVLVVSAYCGIGVLTTWGYGRGLRLTLLRQAANVPPVGFYGTPSTWPLFAATVPNATTAETGLAERYGCRSGHAPPTCPWLLPQPHRCCPGSPGFEDDDDEEEAAEAEAEDRAVRAMEGDGPQPPLPGEKPPSSSSSSSSSPPLGPGPGGDRQAGAGAQGAQGKKGAQGVGSDKGQAQDRAPGQEEEEEEEEGGEGEGEAGKAVAAKRHAEYGRSTFGLREPLKCPDQDPDEEDIDFTLVSARLSSRRTTFGYDVALLRPGPWLVSSSGDADVGGPSVDAASDLRALGGAHGGGRVRGQQQRAGPGPRQHGALGLPARQGPPRLPTKVLARPRQGHEGRNDKALE